MRNTKNESADRVIIFPYFFTKTFPKIWRPNSDFPFRNRYDYFFALTCWIQIFPPRRAVLIISMHLKGSVSRDVRMRSNIRWIKSHNRSTHSSSAKRWATPPKRKVSPSQTLSLCQFKVTKFSSVTDVNRIKPVDTTSSGRKIFRVSLIENLKGGITSCVLRLSSQLSDPLARHKPLNLNPS